MRQIFLLIPVALLVGCSGTKAVVDIGNGTFYQEALTVQAASDNAKQYCSKLGKTMAPVQLNPTNRYNRAELVFTCQ